MRARTVLAILVPALASCSLSLDKVPPPASAPACAPPDCTGKACGYTACGVVCGTGSGCAQTHRVEGAAGPAAGSASSGAHGVSGALGYSPDQAATAPGHVVVQGRISP